MHVRRRPCGTCSPRPLQRLSEREAPYEAVLVTPTAAQVARLGDAGGLEISHRSPDLAEMGRGVCFINHLSFQVSSMVAVVEVSTAIQNTNTKQREPLFVASTEPTIICLAPKHL